MLSQNIKDQFGGFEKDVDLMLSMGVVTEQQVLDEWSASVRKMGLEPFTEIEEPCESCGRILKGTLEAGDELTIKCECGHELLCLGY